MTDQTIACDGCGETDPAKRCIGCLHDFGDPSSLWVRLHDKPTPTAAAIEAYAMTDAAVEAVARAFCKRMGLDPDAPAFHTLTRKNWEMEVTSAREAIAMHLALKEVLG